MLTPTNLDIFKPLIFDLIKYYVKDLDNPTGGSLHIALDDGNLCDDNLFFCQGFAKDAGDTFGYFLATILRHFTEDERESMYEAGWGMEKSTNSALFKSAMKIVERGE